MRHRHGMVGESLSEYGLTVRLRSNYGSMLMIWGVIDWHRRVIQWTHDILALNCAVGRAI